MFLFWFIGVVVCILVIGWGVSRYTSLLPALALVYILINGANVFMYHWNTWAEKYPNLLGAAMLSSAQTCFIILALVVAAIALKNYSGLLPRMLQLLTLFNALWVDVAGLTRHYLGGNSGYTGFVDSSGINGSLIAAGVPFLIADKALVGAILSIIAVILSKSSIAYGVLYVSVFAYLFHQKKYWLLPLAFLALGLGWAFERELFFNSSSRFDAYEVFMTAWWKRPFRLFGTGPGTFYFLGPIIQCETGFQTWKGANGSCQGMLWYQLHSDVLEAIFTHGIVGAILLFSLTLETVKNLFDKSDKDNGATLGFLMGILGCAVFDFPFHEFLIALLYIFVVLFAYSGARKDKLPCPYF